MPDPFWDSFNAGFGAVNALRQNHAMSTYRKDPNKGINELGGVDPELAMRLQQQQQQNALFGQQQQRQGVLDQRQDTTWQQGQDDRQKQQELDATAQKLKVGLPYFYQASQIQDDAQRLQFMQQNAEAIGLDPSRITPETASLNSVQAHLRQGMDVADQLKLDEQHRHNLATEDVGQSRVENQMYGLTHAQPKVFAPKSAGKAKGPSPWSMNWSDQ